MLPLDDAIVGESIIGVKFRLARRLALYIASSAASRMTLSRRFPGMTARSSVVDCFFRIFSGRVRSHDTSPDDETDDCLFLNRALGEPLIDGCREGLSDRDCLNPRRSARESRRLCVVTKAASFGTKDTEFCASRNRSSVEKYYTTNLLVLKRIVAELPGATQCRNVCRYGPVCEGERGPALHATIAPAKERNGRSFNRHLWNGSKRGRSKHLMTGPTKKKRSRQRLAFYGANASLVFWSM